MYNLQGTLFKMTVYVTWFAWFSLAFNYFILSGDLDTGSQVREDVN